MNAQSTIEAKDLLQNGILVATKMGLLVKLIFNIVKVESNFSVVCMTLQDALTSNLNLSVEDLNSVAVQLILQDEASTSTANISSDGTIDSDDITSDCSGIFPPPNEYNISTPGVQLKKAKVQLDLTNGTNKYLTTIVMDNHSHVSDSDASSITTTTTYSDGTTENVSVKTTDDITEDTTNKLPTKRRGGWPKGRKRKPELLHLPPKAPATGYNLYLSDKRKEYKDSRLVFHEITKIIGNRWSSLTLEQKQPYLERAEEDKRRYREELRIYRQSGAYQLYLAKKRRKRVQNNVLSESDMDATDDIDDEDNEELYCRTCDQWFCTLHNKREHLQGRQHKQAILGDMRTELGKNYNEDTPEEEKEAKPEPNNSNNKNESTVTDSITNLITVVSNREKEIRSLKARLKEAEAAHHALYQQLASLKERETKLKDELHSLKDVESQIESDVFKLWKVPSLFVTTELIPLFELSEFLVNE